MRNPTNWLAVSLLVALVAGSHGIAKQAYPLPSESMEVLTTDPLFASDGVHCNAALSDWSRSDQPCCFPSSRNINTDINTQGGIIFFLHIPKTGGTTLRLNLEPYDHINYIFAKNYSIYSDTAPLVEDAILSGTSNKTVLFYEIHASTAPSFYQLRHRLRRWKDIATKNGVPTFFFTLLRDPTAYAFSHFNFFHVQRRNPTFEQCNATLDNFLRLTLFNPQCHFLFQGEWAMRVQKPKNKVLTTQECHVVQDYMLQLLDWIGTTERLSNDTLPLLSRLLNLPENHTWINHKVSKTAQGVNYFGKENVTEAVLEWIKHDMSLMDTGLYQMARDRYRYDAVH
ncbi:sulfotransferase family protein [Nitzschia inconspicua]|uniref:Sulfotransferase family protein n=1 Tax=Nitzschia inconspicua TaxID=303405 RepID=A0A9K3L7J9_9STRA|nr:sulfotransferase family protein [Nitzschia inconspicua]